MAGMTRKACTWLQIDLLGRWNRRGLAIVSSAMWVLVAKVFMQVCQLATFIIAARILTSAEFGLFSYTVAVAALLVVVAEGGWREFVMKTTHEGGRVDQIATVALISGFAATTIGLCAAVILDIQFNLKAEALLVVLVSLWLFPTPFSSVCEGRLIANARLRELSIIRIAAELCATLVAVYGLFHGWNIYALAAGKLVSQLISMAASLVVLKWVPTLKLRISFVRELVDFSKHITSNHVLVLIRSYSGTLVVGSVLGLADAGYYRAAERVVSAFSDLVGEPARQIAWSTLRKIAMTDGGDAPGAEGSFASLGRAATTFVILLMVISAPIYVGLVLMSDTLVHLVLGANWAPAAVLISLLALTQILLVPGYVTEPLLSLTGAIRKVPAAILVNSLVSIGLILAFSPFGVVAAAAGQSIAAVFSILVSGWLQSRYGGVRWPAVIKGCILPIVGSVAMASAVLLLGRVDMHSVESDLIVKILQMLVGCLIYGATVGLLYKISSRVMAARAANWGGGSGHVGNRF
ncbi:O-antigen/teichoic acid export membrane protein [Pseudorhizobium tarimense]|uniref:O-antigen/teichoic acid export membrane protein n=1 Tax=Pseudorhizobium tarimense TaxID=1079109 RepID=A0ABV2H4B3_9HYPH|nr:oligosaccharide flippase family protein [Pseudorhizobium tarimense]MCJ8518609.1 oligosaccharide flippase family protein [Pseudorhizobium tarimense]